MGDDDQFNTTQGLGDVSGYWELPKESWRASEKWIGEASERIRRALKAVGVSEAARMASEAAWRASEAVAKP